MLMVNNTLIPQIFTTNQWLDKVKGEHLAALTGSAAWFYYKFDYTLVLIIKHYFLYVHLEEFLPYKRAEEEVVLL